MNWTTFYLTYHVMFIVCLILNNYYNGLPLLGFFLLIQIWSIIGWWLFKINVVNKRKGTNKLKWEYLKKELDMENNEVKYNNFIQFNNTVWKSWIILDATKYYIEFYKYKYNVIKIRTVYFTILEIVMIFSTIWLVYNKFILDNKPNNTIIQLLIVLCVIYIFTAIPFIISNIKLYITHFKNGELEKNKKKYNITLFDEVTYWQINILQILLPLYYVYFVTTYIS